MNLQIFKQFTLPLLLLTACQPPVTYAPNVTREELAREQAYQEQLIEDVKARGGTKRAWRNEPHMRKTFETVAMRLEDAGAQVCKEVGAPQQGRRCYYYFEISRDASPNAYADGERVVVHAGMMRFVANEEELALVMAHELAHNIMGHPQAGATNATIGSIAGLVLDSIAQSQGMVTTGGTFSQVGARAGKLTYSIPYEQEADYVGLYIMARAGYDIRKAADFWRRFSVEMQTTGERNPTHPTNAERFIAIQKIIYEIEYKRKHRVPLTPDFLPAT